jgi:hypothetical protein
MVQGGCVECGSRGGVAVDLRHGVPLGLDDDKDSAVDPEGPDDGEMAQLPVEQLLKSSLVDPRRHLELDRVQGHKGRRDAVRDESRGARAGHFGGAGSGGHQASQRRAVVRPTLMLSMARSLILGHF